MADAAGSSPALLEPANTPSPEITSARPWVVPPGSAARLRTASSRAFSSSAAMASCLRVGAESRGPDLHLQPASLCPPQCRRGFAAAVVVFSVPGLGGVFLQ